jgi:hypothetical protein
LLPEVELPPAIRHHTKFAGSGKSNHCVANVKAPGLSDLIDETAQFIPIELGDGRYAVDFYEVGPTQRRTVCSALPVLQAFAR